MMRSVDELNHPKPKLPFRSLLLLLLGVKCANCGVPRRSVLGGGYRARMRSFGARGAAVEHGGLFTSDSVGQNIISGPRPSLRVRSAADPQVSQTAEKGGAESTNDIAKLNAVKDCLRREYTSFFEPMEREFYAPSVQFVDPMTSFEGIDKYQNNVDMLAGRTLFGQVAFSDAKLQLHDVTETGPRSLRSRWTLKFTFQLMPWKPECVFTGVSDYTLDANFKIVKQEDYWDSINLEKGGKYVKRPVADGLSDFLSQLFKKKTREYMVPELPYVLLRRGNGYSIRAYPGYTGVEVAYSNRREAWEQLERYSIGQNELNARFTPFVPSIMQIEATDSGSWSKKMRWVMKFTPPGQKDSEELPIPPSTASNCDVISQPSTVYAVKTFSEPLTDDTVTRMHDELLSDLKRDGLIPEFEEHKTFVQFDEVYYLGERRNEIWVPMEGHPWPY